MSQSLSNLFSSSTSGATIGLFSESAKQKFARVYKPEEFDVPVKKVKEPVEGEAEDVEPIEEDDKKKKRKERKRKAEVSVDADGVAIPAADAPAPVEGESKDLDTIFVGNIPVTETQKSLTKFFKTYGEIDNIRLRSVPVAGAKVDEAGNQDLVRKVCVNSKKFGEQKGSFNAYIKFKEASAATASLAANNQLMGTRHLRVDRSNPTLFDPKRSVFLGGLPHYADEEEMREYFAKSLDNGHDDIEGMRIIRDPTTLVGKGIGYILFKDRDCVAKALALHKSVYKKRWALRVSACGKRTKRTEHAKIAKDGEAVSAEGAEGAEGTDSALPIAQLDAKGRDKPFGNARSNKFSRENRSDDRGGKRARGPEGAHPAARRVKHKTVVTRNKLLKERKQKKEKGRHGKRLGGVVKRAMKAQAKK